MPDKITKFIKALDEKTRSRLKEKLLEVKKNPFSSGDIKKLQGTSENLYRLRLGKIRVVYKILKSDIEIVDIDYRGNIY
ncbi:type II toxin-antitoxin system RelE/ParE family toxin [Candidatus Peregrinibacteria bacterium CG_4_10_14_0_2_um_filter_38_24]|nr:MAG: type II toxin-antitoxin system RelE/ParE family toxin [Candidatus Peregrinibacteria bacterium CG_4_10_14_0_2_um_filter_38_24]PJC39122.1 MAG: type II toxin-antitoxin system RelE/ParE family toxin [Candidatus Peregrinibacteria bacterium CG_4_9_14_0_2_um_filter_38_9]